MTVMYSQLGSWGRLGNQLWEIASTIGLSTRTNERVAFNRWDYEPYFNVANYWFLDIPEGTEAALLATHLPESERMYLQDYNLWKDLGWFVNRIFRPSPLARKQLEEFFWFSRIQGPKVAIHVRRDERVNAYSQTHPTPPMEYYEIAIKTEKERLGSPVFCVFSDDIEWCRERFPSDFVYVEGYPRHQDAYLLPNEPEWRDHLDLFLMTQCDGHIIPNSTFSWWGAFLSKNKSPIYPAVWYGPELDHIDWRLQIPPGWTEVDWR